MGHFVKWVSNFESLGGFSGQSRGFLTISAEIVIPRPSLVTEGPTPTWGIVLGVVFKITPQSSHMRLLSPEPQEDRISACTKTMCSTSTDFGQLEVQNRPRAGQNRPTGTCGFGGFGQNLVVFWQILAKTTRSPGLGGAVFAAHAAPRRGATG